MTETVQRTEHSVVLGDEGGDTRFVLVRCPACDQPLSPEQWPRGSDERAIAEAVDVHLLARHFPPDFGLERDEHDFQARLGRERSEGFVSRDTVHMPHRRAVSGGEEDA